MAVTKGKKATTTKKVTKKVEDKKPENKMKKSKADNGGNNDAFLQMIGGDMFNKNYLSKEFKFDIMRSSMTSLNRATGAGGIITGGIWEIFGENHSGKTALAIRILADAQEQGHLTMFADGERSANDDRWTKAIGWYKEKGLYFRPKSFENCRATVNKTINTFLENRRKGKIPKDKKLFILIDSVPTLVPKDCLLDDEKEENTARFGKVAQLMSDWLPVLLTKVGDDDDAPSNVTVMFINQTRQKIGAGMFEEKTKTYGGEALAFYAQVRIKVSKIEDTKQSIGGVQKKVGKKHKVTLRKSKIGVGEEATFFTSSGRGDAPLGFDTFKEVLTEAIFRKKIEKTKKKIACDFLDEEWGSEKEARKWFDNNPDKFQKFVNYLNDTITELDIKTDDDEGEADDE